MASLSSQCQCQCQWQFAGTPGVHPQAAPPQTISLRPSLLQSSRLSAATSRPRLAQAPLIVRAADGEAPEAKAPPPPAAGDRTIFCVDCEGNGAVPCRQCEGGGVNLKDHFDGRFKEGQLCWLCRGKKQILCGQCNGAGFVGGFLSTQDD